MKKTTGIVALAVLTCVSAIAQPIEVRTKQRVEEVRDADGGVSRIEYDRDEKRVSRVVTPHSVTTFSYHGEGEANNTLTVTVDGLKLVVENTADGGISTPGMPTILPPTEFKAGNQVQIRTSGGDPIINYEFRPNGDLTGVSIPGATLTVSDAKGEKGIVTETLLDGAKKVVATTTTTADLSSSTRNLQLGLDVITGDLGLPPDWTGKVSRRDDSVGSLGRLVNTSGATVGYLVYADHGNTVVFSTKGKPLAYDIKLNVLALRSFGVGNPAAEQRTGGVRPDHVVYAANGNVGFYVGQATEHAFQSVWTTKDGIAYRTYSEGGHSTTSTNALSNGRETHDVGTNIKRTIKPLTLNQYLYTVCVTTAVARYCTEYYGSPDSGSDEGTGTSSGGGGAGGGGTTANTSGVKTAVRSSVNSAIVATQSKLQTARCAALLNMTPSTAATSTFGDYMMAQRHFSDPYMYINYGMVYQSDPGGINSRCDAAHTAYTSVYSNTVNICDSFASNTWSVGKRADFIIHEMLHTLGLPENPPYASAMTSDQIQSMVEQACD